MSILLQDNLNHSHRAQDIMIQSLVELDGVVAVVAEPYNVSDHLSEDGSVAIYFRWSRRWESTVFSSLERGKRFLAVQ